MGGNQSSAAAGGAPSDGAGGAATMNSTVPIQGGAPQGGGFSSSGTGELMSAWTVQAPTSEMSSVSSDTRIPIPKPKGTEVLIKVVCAGVNPVDWKRAGFPPGGFAYPCVLGCDCSGTIMEIGDAVDPQLGLTVGAPVSAHLNIQNANGAFAEYTVTEASTVVKIAPNVTFADAAALPCAAWTAYAALFEKLKIQSGKTIFISGGSGGVGSFAVQLAKYMQLTVMTSCSTSNVDFVKSLGADLVIDYTVEDVAEKVLFFTRGEGIDYVFETVSAANGVKAAQLLKFSGSIVNIVGTLSVENFFFERQLSAHHVFLGGHHRDEANRAVLRRIGETVMAMTAAGVVKVPSLELIRFEQVRDALELSKKGHVRGKIVLSMVPRKEANKSEQQRRSSTTGTTAAAPTATTN